MNKFFLDLGQQPLANNYLAFFKDKQIKYNLKLFFNTKNKIVSISKRIQSKKMFTNNYPYRSSMSKTMKNSFFKLSLEIKKKFNPKKILEIGSNDGALITNFDKKKVIGIEPCNNLAKITSKKGFITYNKYWNYKLAQKLKRKHGNIDLIYSANTLTHISNLNDVFRSISYLLSKKGILIIEDPSLLECMKKTAYDQFYCEHIYVYSAIALSNILKKFKLEIFDIEHTSTHGGSNRYYIKKGINKKLIIRKNVFDTLKKEIRYGLKNFITYKKFSKRVNNSKMRLIKIFNDLKNKKIIGYGATAKSCTVLNFCKIGTDNISYFYDTTSYKIGKYLPGTKIEIRKYKKLNHKKIDYVFLGAWNFKSEIFKKEKKFKKLGGKFITHIPKPQII